MKKIMLALCATLSLGVPATVGAQEAYMGEIRWFGSSYCPKGWLVANGQTMSISQNSALFSLLGTTYGGNGVTTYGLPNLAGRSVIGSGSGAGGLQTHVNGEMSGTETVVLTYSQLPAYVMTANPTAVAVAKAPAGSDPATTVNVPSSYSATGAGLAHDNRSPYLVMQPCIAAEGIYPSRP